MGEVYKARDTRLNRTVAIKVLPRTVSPDGQRFLLNVLAREHNTQAMSVVLDWPALLRRSAAR